MSLEKTQSDLMDKNPIISNEAINNDATVSKLQGMQTSLRRYKTLLKAENQHQDCLYSVQCQGVHQELKRL